MNDRLTLKEEEKLVSECKKNISVFEKLYKNYVEDIYRYVYIVVNNKEKAEDITSQTFLTALEKIRQFEWRGISIKFWFLKIARNIASKSLRETECVRFDEKIAIKDVDKILVEDIVIEKELKNKIKELIFKLDERTREIISLRIWEDLKFKEISKILGMNQSTVINRFARGIKKLKKILEQEEEKLAVSLATIIVGIKYLKETVEFLPSKGFKNYLATQIASKLNLTITKTDMKAVEKQIAKGAKLSKPFVLKVAAVAIVVLAGITAGGYLLIKNLEKKEEVKDEIKDEEKKDEEEEDIVEEKEDTVSPPEAFTCPDGWEIYEDTELGYKFCYPSDWNVEQYEEDNPLAYRLSVNKNEGYNIDFFLYEGNYPYYCIYSDTDESQLPDDPLGNNKEFDDHTEVKNEKVTYRRSGWDVWGTQIEHIVCEKDEDGLYNSFIDPVYISYRVPFGEVDDAQLQILDTILLSFTKVDPYAGWKTYSNTELGITIKYPSEWEVNEEILGTFGTITSYLITITTDSSSTLTLLNYVEGPQMPNSSENTSSVSMQLSDGSTVYRVNESSNKTNYYYALKVTSGAYAGDWNTFVKLGENEFSMSIKQTAENASELETFDKVVTGIAF